MQQVALTQLQDPLLGLVEIHEVPMDPLLKLVQILLDGIPPLWQVICTTQLGSFENLLRVHSILSSMSLMKTLNNSVKLATTSPQRGLTAFWLYKGWHEYLEDYQMVQSGSLVKLVTSQKQIDNLIDIYGLTLSAMGQTLG
ncbi:hypothetical protein DUI87_10584 [Hirundo rustica rustica]|uniref:Uncharacterized protein n=1 Tax=Hirundo rustica rustica TaxID=333673 RepID=A0A3M0KP65_HIRRU|nr:hypothetical protein DUI87_10584 [Hirundo rustica rustica]